MLPTPLHPAVVHFPIVLATALPVAALLALLAIRRGSEARRAWAIPLALAVALSVSGWVALETGEAEEERVEAVVGDAPIHEHEQAAERFLVLAGVLTLVAGAGLLRGPTGAAARMVAGVGTLVVLAAAFQVGRAGGELVYGQGAARAYERIAPGSPAGRIESREAREHH